MRKDTLDCVNLLPLLLGQFCLVPSPSVPCTYPITRCLSPALTSSFLLTFTAAAESRCLFLHPRRTCACSRGSPPRPSLETRLSQQGFFLFFFPQCVESRCLYSGYSIQVTCRVSVSTLSFFSVTDTPSVTAVKETTHVELTPADCLQWCSRSTAPLRFETVGVFQPKSRGVWSIKC